MRIYSDIYDYVIQQEKAYQQKIPVFQDWEWSMAEHIRTSMFYKYGRLLTGNTDDKPVKNIVRPILNLAYRAEDIDVKDITIYVDDADKYHLSLLVKKYHDEVFIKETKLDDFFDEVKEEKIDFGGALIQKTSDAKPIKVPLQSIAFCDQSNILGAPFAIKLSLSPDELMEMKEKGWGDKANNATISVDEAILLAEYEKEKDKKLERKIQTPGKYIDVYLVWGVMPNRFIKANDEKFSLQLHFITFLQLQDGQKVGHTFFSAFDKEKKRFKFVNRDKVYGRALGYGGIEELFEAQAWTNSSLIWKTDMLRAASKMVMQTADAGVVARHPTGLKNLENWEVIEHEEGKPITQVNTTPVNITLFNNAINEWEAYAQRVGSATDPLLGEEPKAGTPFRLQERVVIEGKGIHEYRREKYARFIEEIYQDWIIPYISKELTKDTQFLATLTPDELEFIAINLVTKKVNDLIIERILNGDIPTQEELQTFREQMKTDFLTGGNKRFINILKDELKNVPLRVKVDIAGAQKNLGLVVDKLSNIFRQIFINPTILQDPRAQKVFNKILEYSGLSQIDFSSFTPPAEVISQETKTLSELLPQTEESALESIPIS